MNSLKDFGKKNSLILALALLLTACGTETAGKEEQTSAEGTSSEAVSEVQTETNALDLRASYKDNLPDDLDFEGREFTIFLPDDRGQNLLMEGDIELSGDVINDAVRARNMSVEERLNIKLNYQTDNTCTWDKATKKLQTFILSGDSTLDMYLGQQLAITSPTLVGGFSNCFDLEYLDFSNPWWNTDYMDQLTVLDHDRVFLVGDYFADIILDSHVLYFNDTMYQRLFPNDKGIYDMVLDGTWTFDKMMKIVKDAYIDLDNSGTTGIEDQLGFMGDGPWATVDPFQYLSGIPFIQRTEEGTIESNLFDERHVKLQDQVMDFFNQPGMLWKGTGGLNLSNEFMNGNVLILGISNIYRAFELRDMEDDYGMIPYPKLNEEQERYCNISANGGLLGTVSASSENLDIAGAVVEALSAETYRTVTPAWFDVALKVKYSRSEHAAEILDIIRTSVYDEFGHAFSNQLNRVGNLFSVLMERNSRNYMSVATSKEKSFKKKLDKLVSAYEEQRG